MKKIVMLLLLASCDSPKDAVRDVKFYREPKSKLCFASGTMQVMDSVSSTFTWVPCDQIPPELIVPL
jgi:hypothetical protein